ncbi:MAG: hypothetical protein Kilf2KO_46870 [Rhodospirillales bacterium]
MGWTATTFIKAQIIRASIRIEPFSYPIRVRVFEAVDRLIVITDYANVCRVRHKLNNALFRAIKILVFVYKNVRVFAPFGGGRI